MSTAVLNTVSAGNVDMRLKNDAEIVLEQLGYSVEKAVNLLLRFVIARKELPEDLKKPPVPCLDDMTEEEFDAMISEAMESVKAGRTVPAEELRKEMAEQYDFKF
ncbi:MAG: type II toxin-antitoxin system RelB/DinJ family antitoxin [Synergistaceae bacterium]|nr:type II toxin-antitoxin system RelB/DinJ family antitoxin [Synergistaceae bacterium]MBQ3398305.1 type II toxin-antitoxin system RelB/DinJ family antitoxin [Synergistaceae bacterium]MBQ6417297.1 type II toxin-antitoxin system RelB/DinJ family antitoxin [Synergistaceae bacterium]